MVIPRKIGAFLRSTNMPFVYHVRCTETNHLSRVASRRRALWSWNFCQKTSAGPNLWPITLVEWWRISFFVFFSPLSFVIVFYNIWVYSGFWWILELHGITMMWKVLHLKRKATRMPYVNHIPNFVFHKILDRSWPVPNFKVSQPSGWWFSTQCTRAVYQMYQ